MDVAARGMTDDKAYRTSLPQCRNAHTTPNARLQSLRRDLSTPQEHHGVDRLERNALVTIRRRGITKQGCASMGSTGWFYYYIVALW